jgi:integrase
MPQMSVFKRKGSPFYQTEFIHRGRRVSRSTQTTSRREAEAFERTLREQVKREHKEVAAAPALTLDAACGRYWEQHGTRLRWARDVARNLKYVVALLDPTMPLAELANRHVADLVEGRRQQGAGIPAINRTLSVLQGVHSRAASRWDIPVKAIAWRDFKGKERGRVRWITEAEAGRLLAALPEHISRLVRFLLLTGVRQREAFELTWDRVAFDRGAFWITAKGGVRREVALSAEALLLLHETPQAGRFVFDRTNWRKHFEKACKAAGISDFRWHDLRHTHATWLRQKGVALEVVSQSLGHSGIAVTQKYAHVAQHEVREALQLIPALRPSSNVQPLRWHS